MSAVEKFNPQDIISAPVHSAALTPMDMLNTALSRGADMAVLERLMGLHERWEANQARKAFDAAISEAKAQIKPIARNAKGHNDKTYADFAAIAREVDPILAAHGLSYRFRTDQADTKIHVTCILSHKDGHSETTTLAGPADNSGSKNAIQAIGSTLTYLQRYSLVQMLGLASAKDDDGKTSGMGAAMTDDQLNELRGLIMETNSNIKLFCKHYGIETVEDLPASKFEQAKAALLRKLGAL